MRITTVSTFAGLVAMTIIVPSVHAQRPRFSGATRPAVSRAPLSTLPSSPIWPMTNPILPMTNPVAPITVSPVQPIAPTPFIRYGGIPTVVVPETSTGRGRKPVRERSRGKRGSRALVPAGIILTGGTQFPYTINTQPELNPPATVPGSLPPTNSNSPLPVNPSPANTFIYVDQPQTVTRPLTPVARPNPRPPVRPPAIGASWADVKSLYGDPWGIIWARGRETHYFDSGLVVVVQDGLVVEAR